MNRIAVGCFILVALVATACGRRLPEDYVVNDASAVSVAAESTDADETEGETTEDAAEASTDADTTTEDVEDADDESAEAETSADEAESTDDETADAEDSDEEIEADESEGDEAEDNEEEETDTTPESTGDPEAGAALFVSVPGNAACSTCHLVDSEQMLVGPGMANIATHVADRADGDIVGYLRQSILEPNAHVVEGYPPGVMPQTYADSLTEDQINDLIAYMLSL